jgi:hypothetical protein
MPAFAQTLTDFGQRFGLPGLAPDADGHCELRFDEKYAVHLQHDAEQNTLTLYTVVGQVPPLAKQAAYEMLLKANLFWLGTDGATLGLDAQSGTVFLARRLALAEFSVASLEGALKSLVDNAEYWGRELAQGGQGGHGGSRPPHSHVRV